MEPKLISAASVVLTLPLKVSKLPKRGNAVIAQAEVTGVGEAADVMLAAAAQGVKVINASCLGTGPNSILARQILQKFGICTTSTELVGDIGMKMMLVEEDGYYTSVYSDGVEADLSIQEMQRLEVDQRDIIYISAGDLLHEAYREVMFNWLPSLDPKVTVVMAATALISEVRPEWFARVLPYVQVMTCNDQEANTLDPAGKYRAIVDKMADGACLILRNGEKGTKIIGRDYESNVDSVPVKMGDTLGVGAAHTGVLIAGIIHGLKMEEALWRANLAGAMVAGRYGANVCPSASEISEVSRLIEKGYNPLL